MSVPIHSNFIAKQIRHIIEQTKMKTLFVSKNNLEKAIKVAGKSEHLKYLVCMDEEFTTSKEERKEKMKEKNCEAVELLCLKEMLVEEDKWHKLQPKKPNDVATLIYTSGSTGVPKGSMVVDQMINKDLGYEKNTSLRAENLISFMFGLQISLHKTFFQTLTFFS